MVIKVTLKDLNKVVREVMEYVGTCDKYDRDELIDIIGEFGIDQFSRGFKVSQKARKEKER